MKKIISKLKSNYIIWLVLILALGFLVRLYKINNPLADWHSWRQADTASVSRYYFENGISASNFFSPRYHDISSIQSGITNPKGYRLVELPMFNVAHAFLAKLNLPLTFEGSGRLVSIICWLISTILIYLIGSRSVGRLAGLFSAFFFAFIPYNVYFSRVILPEPMAVTFSLASVWFYLKFIHKEKDLDFYLSAVFIALAMLIKPFTIFFLLGHTYLALNKFGLKVFTDPKLLIKHLIYLDIAAIPFFVWRIVINKFPAGIPAFEWAFNGDGIRFRPAFWRWIFGERIGKLILGVWGLVPFAMGLIVKDKKNWLNIALFFGSVVYMSVVATASVRHDYYQILIIPSVALLAGSGAYHLVTNKNFNQVISRGLVIFCTGLMIGLGAYQIKEFYKINHPEIIAAGEAIDKIASKDALVIAPYVGDTAFLYQTKRWGWPAIDDSLENIIKKGADYYVTVTPGDADTKEIQKKYKTIVTEPQYVIVDLNQPLKK